MNYWLLKTEPSTYSWDDLVNEGTGMWDGVRNYGARNNLRAMKKGDLAFIYHSVNDKEIIGIAEIVKEHYPDPTVEGDRWSAVSVKAVRKLKKKISLNDIKSNENLQDMVLVNNTRLSVQPVTEAEFKEIMAMAGEGKK